MINTMNTEIRDSADSINKHTGLDVGFSFSGGIESSGARVDDDGYVTAQYGFGTPLQGSIDVGVTAYMGKAPFPIPEWFGPGRGGRQ